jgi:hypothetical protein
MLHATGLWGVEDVHVYVARLGYPQFAVVLCCAVLCCAVLCRTKPNLPPLVTTSRVTVLDEEGGEIEIRNPFQPYQYVVSVCSLGLKALRISS